MNCHVCGDDRTAEYRPAKRQSLCRDCNSSTPRKVSRTTFDAHYWNNDPSVPESTRREFYADYLASTDTLAGYIAATTHAE